MAPPRKGVASGLHQPQGTAGGGYERTRKSHLNHGHQPQPPRSVDHDAMEVWRWPRDLIPRRLSPLGPRLAAAEHRERHQ
jgi:hypothetical protein